jgi:hypothetical protein
MTDTLRPLWDFQDLDATERRFRDLLAGEREAGVRAEILSQLARVEGLRGEFEQGEELLREAETLAGQGARARVRLDLERGRILRSSGHPDRALPLFERATEGAGAAGELFIAADAAHMAAIAASDPNLVLAWTRRGIELAESGDGSGRYWLGPLLNNLGWHHFERGRYDDALDAFTRALRERERDPGNADAIALARYAVAKALRALGRPPEAVPLLEQAVASADGAGRPDGWYHEELALAYADVGREDDAAAHARLALPLLERDDPSLAEGGSRADRLRELARL